MQIASHLLLIMLGWLGTVGFLWWWAKRLGLPAAAIMCLACGVLVCGLTWFAQSFPTLLLPGPSDPYNDTYYYVIRQWQYAFVVASLCVILTAMTLLVDRICGRLMRQIAESATAAFFVSVGSQMASALWLLPVVLGDPDGFPENALLINQWSGLMAFLAAVSAATLLACFVYAFGQLVLRRIR